MQYFVNDINQLEHDIQKNFGFDYDLDEVIYEDFEHYFNEYDKRNIFYNILADDEIELVYSLKSSSSLSEAVTDVLSILTVDEVRFLLFDFVDICIIIVNKKQRTDLRTIINSLV